MNQFALTYLLGRAFYRLRMFFEHWYVGSFLAIGGQTLNFLTRLDQTFALKVTATHLTAPLYQDHSIVGHALGFFFRFWRLVITAVIYAVVVAAAAAVYVAWAAIPFAIIYRALVL